MLDKTELSGAISRTLDPQEIAKFDSLAEQWWDPLGKYGQAIAFNHARLAYFTQQIATHYDRELAFLPKPTDNLWRLYDLGTVFSGLSILDVGSGGGLVSEPLANLGADVTGIDASAMSIEVAKRYAFNTESHVRYEHALAATKVAEGAKYDVVINAEVVEHVRDQAQLIKECTQLVRPGGMLILATLNRTLLSYVLAIVGAEYVMRYLPIGTHSWRKFVKPDELLQWARDGSCVLHDQTGMQYNPINKIWSFASKMKVNYVMCFVKKGPSDENL